MNLKTEKILIELIAAYPELKDIQKKIVEAYKILKESFLLEGKLLVAGNGGSCCDSGHIVGELMKGFINKREILKTDRVSVKGVEEKVLNSLYDGLQYGLRAIDLTSQQGLITAISNDNGAELIFAQQVWGYGKKEDVFLGLSTSGNSKNIIMAGMTAKSKGMKIIGFCGSKISDMDELFDVVVKVPSTSTPKIQELHLPIYHTICLMLEETFF